MSRQKVSLNKKNENVELEFESTKEISPGEFMSKNEELEEIQKEIDQSRIELEKTRMEIETKKQELKTMPVTPKLVDAPAVSIKNEGLSEKIASQKVYDNQMVTGKFYNLRAPGQSAKLTYMHHVDDPVKWYTFNHGEVYTIQRGFADEINDHYHTPNFIKNENVILDPSNPESGIHSVDKSNKKYSFVPLNF